MILGSVNESREAVIQIAVLNNRKQTKSVSGVIDTGYTGDLILPVSIVNELDLKRRGIQEALLGDGSIKTFEMYAALVIWDGQIRRVEINASEAGTLVGMGLLEGYKLEIEGKPRGKVSIVALP